MSMINKNRQLFPFDERNEIKMKIQFPFKKQRNNKPIKIDASIKYDGAELLLYAEESLKSKKTNNDLQSLFMVEFTEDYYVIQDAKVNDLPIEIIKLGVIRFNSSQLEKDKKVFSMQIKDISYSYKGNKSSKCYRICSAASVLLIPYLTDFAYKGNTIVGMVPTRYNGKLFNRHLSLFRDDKYVYIKAKDNISDILSVLSFFFCNPVEYDMACTCNNDGEYVVDVIPPNYKVIAAKKNNILEYLYSNDKDLGYLTDFFEITRDSGSKFPISDILKRYIDNFVRVEYLDNISKLLLYETILEKMAGVEINQKAYSIIRSFLKDKHINVEKINDHISNNKLKNEKDKTIFNFVQLRHFFVHHLGSKEAADFLQNSDMLFYLKEAITILILEELGIKDIKFDKVFHEISIFDDKVDECETFSRLLKGNE